MDCALSADEIVGLKWDRYDVNNAPTVARDTTTGISNAVPDFAGIAGASDKFTPCLLRYGKKVESVDAVTSTTCS
jgi:hypothetical protein